MEYQGVLFLTKTWSVFSDLSYTFGNDLTRDEPLRVPPVFGDIGTRWTYRSARVGLFAELWTEMMGRFDRLGEFDFRDIRIPDGGNPAWQTLNARVGIDADEYGALTMGLLNMFDQNYRYPGSGVDAAGIEFRVGYVLNF
jgi:hemoglobin/transferrin/lactoferrin receptor protein